MQKCKICQSDKIILDQKNLFDNRYGYHGYFDIYLCQNCGFRQTYPELKDEQLSNLYTNYYPRKNQNIQELKNNFVFKNNKFDKLQRWFNGNNNKCFYHLPAKKMKVLDIGCGTGFSLFFIQKIGGEAYGIEEDENAARIAKELNLNIEIGNIYNSKHEEKTFDYIIGSQILEHIPDPALFLKSIKRKLKDDGKIILSFPNANSLTRKIFNHRWIHWHIPYHLSHFSFKNIKFLANIAGLKIEEIKTITPADWTILQLLSFKNKQKEGEKGMIWNKKNAVKRFGLKRIVFYARNKVLRFVINIVNKIIDLSQNGDSFLVAFSKKR